jgi:ankyrin repeat protein
MIVAGMNGHPAVVKSLLLAGADLNAKNNIKETAIDVAQPDLKAFLDSWNNKDEI